MGMHCRLRAEEDLKLAKEDEEDDEKDEAEKEEEEKWKKYKVIKDDDSTRANCCEKNTTGNGKALLRR